MGNGRERVHIVRDESDLLDWRISPGRAPPGGRRTRKQSKAGATQRARHHTGRETDVLHACRDPSLMYVCLSPCVYVSLVAPPLGSGPHVARFLRLDRCSQS